MNRTMSKPGMEVEAGTEFCLYMVLLGVRTLNVTKHGSIITHTWDNFKFHLLN